VFINQLVSRHLPPTTFAISSEQHVGHLQATCQSNKRNSYNFNNWSRWRYPGVYSQKKIIRATVS